MSDKEHITCPECGEIFEESVNFGGKFRWDVSINFDGTVNRKGVMCPHCSSQVMDSAIASND